MEIKEYVELVSKAQNIVRQVGNVTFTIPDNCPGDGWDGTLTETGVYMFGNNHFEGEFFSFEEHDTELDTWLKEIMDEVECMFAFDMEDDIIQVGDKVAWEDDAFGECKICTVFRVSSEIIDVTFGGSEYELPPEECRKVSIVKEDETTNMKELPTSDLVGAVLWECDKDKIIDNVESFLGDEDFRNFLLACLDENN